MSKTTAITIIVTVLLIITGGLFWWYYSLNQTMSGTTDTSTSETGGGLFPFGNTTNLGNRNNNTAATTSEEKTPAPSVREISSSPISGFLPLEDVVNGSFVRYVETETGNVFDTPLLIVTKQRISNTTLPQIRDVLFLPHGGEFIARYLGGGDAIQSFFATLTLPQTRTSSSATSSEGHIDGKFLTENIADVSLITPLSASTTPKNPARIFYITVQKSGSTGFIANGDGSKATKVFTSAFKEWKSFPISESTIYLQTKPSGKAGGYLFTLNTKTGSLLPLIKNAIGLSVLPNKDGSMILFSETSTGAPHLHLYNTVTKKITDISLVTFAEKCTWMNTAKDQVLCAVPNSLPEALYPDQWYQGEVALTDSLWSIRAENAVTKQLVDLPNNNYFIDTEIIKTTPGDTHALIRNKTDQTLWAIEIGGKNI